MQKCMKKNVWIVLVLVAALSITGCTQQAAAPDGSLALSFLKEIDQLGPRTAGTELEKKAADFVADKLKGMGYEVKRTPFDYEDNGTKHSENVIAVKKGTGKGTIIVGAHYDSVDAAKGVDDNGSGIAVALEAAQSLQKTDTVHTLAFVFFGAEEVDLLGSAYYTEQMTPEQIADTVLMVNFDSLVAGDIAYVYGNPDEKGKFREHVLALATQEKINLITQQGLNPEFQKGTTGPWSDHAAFEALGIPFIYFESTNWNLGEMDGYTQVDLTLGEEGEVWHTQYDTYDYIDKTFPGRIAERLTVFAKVIKKILSEDLSGI